MPHRSRLCVYAFIRACWQDTPCISAGTCGPVARRIALRRALALRYRLTIFIGLPGSFTSTALISSHACSRRNSFNEPDPGPRCDRRYHDDLRRSCVVFAWWCWCTSTRCCRRTDDRSKYGRRESHRCREHCNCCSSHDDNANSYCHHDERVCNNERQCRYCSINRNDADTWPCGWCCI